MFSVFVFRRRKYVSNNKKSYDCESYESINTGYNQRSSSHPYTSRNNIAESTAAHDENDESYVNAPLITEPNISDKLPLTITSGTEEQSLKDGDASITTKQFWHVQLNTDTGEEIYENLAPVNGNCWPDVTQIDKSLVNPAHAQTDDKTVDTVGDFNRYPCIEIGPNTEDDEHSGENIPTQNSTSTSSTDDGQGNINE
jgi:hypothetical protein